MLVTSLTSWCPLLPCGFCDNPPTPRFQQRRVSAIEKSTGKSSALTITNDKGTLSKEQIDQMIQVGLIPVCSQQVHDAEDMSA